MKASIDFGTSLTKVVWQNNVGEFVFSSTAEKPLTQIAKEMKEAGIKQINVSGIRSASTLPEEFNEFNRHDKSGDLIQNEIQLQTVGAKKLLNKNGDHLPNFLLVSIGTGTSYAIVKQQYTAKFPLGNSLGGGFIAGMTNALKMENLTELATRSNNGQPLDILIKNILPEKTGRLEGEMTIANFGQIKKDSSLDDVCATTINCVAVSIVRDIMLISMFPESSSIKDVVFIGSTLKHFPRLQYCLQQYSSIIGKNFKFLENGEFALAIGAYYLT